MRNRRTGITVSLAVLAMGALLGACETRESWQAASDYRWNPSPELDTLCERRVDMDNQVAITSDENWRQFNADLGVWILADRPSRLSIYPVP
jgi:hypothetical protein